MKKRAAKKNATPPVKAKPRQRPTKHATKKTTMRARKRNPSTSELEEAASLSEGFHGRPAHKASEYTESADQRQVLSDLGELIELTVKSPDGKAQIIFDSTTRLAASPDGGQLYIIGGDQSIDLEALGLDDQATKDHVEIGPVTLILYGTKKGFDNFESINYKHRFGEDNGTPPTLCADRLNDRLFFVGGTYQIQPQGITN